MDPIKEVYEKYRHLDGILSDQDWLEGADFKFHIMADLWKAVKAVVIASKIDKDVEKL